MRGGTGDASTALQDIQVEPPSFERTFGPLLSDEMLTEAIRQRQRDQKQMGRIIFPNELPLSTQPFAYRKLTPTRKLVEPNYVCHGRLFFEDLNSERYGWDLGILQPVVSAGYFYMDIATLPHHLASDPCRCYECGTGYCLPGDPVPYLIYPPGLSLKGGIAETAAVLALIAIFP